MYTVYILLSLKDKGLYVGCTSNFLERIKKHNKGQVKATAQRRPLVPIYTENNLDKISGFKRERFLKSLWSSRFKKKIKEEYIRKNNLG